MNIVRTSFIFTLLSSMFVSGIGKRPLKRKRNGDPRPSRQQLLRELNPALFLDRRTRKSLRNLLALDDNTEDWIDKVRNYNSKRNGLSYFCSSCGSCGTHLLHMGVSGGLYYRCLECGGNGIATAGGCTAMFEIDSGYDYSVSWICGGIMEDCEINYFDNLEDTAFGISGVENLFGGNEIGLIHGNGDVVMIETSCCKDHKERGCWCCCGIRDDMICEGCCSISNKACVDSYNNGSEMDDIGIDHFEQHDDDEHGNGSDLVDTDDDIDDDSVDDINADPNYDPNDNGDGGDNDLIDTSDNADGNSMDVETVEGSSCSDVSSANDNEDVKIGVKFYEDACANCYRKAGLVEGASGIVDVDRSVQLQVCWLKSGSFSRAISNVKFVEARTAAVELDSGYCKRGAVRVKLCRHCKAALTHDYRKVSEKDKWPALVWKWLTDRRLLLRYGEDVWKIVPCEWRLWWERAVKDCIPVMCNVTLDKPCPIFADVTDRKAELELGIAGMNAVEMRRVCNEHLFPLVRCPWGCSEYFHKCGKVSYDLVVRKILGSAVTPISGDESYIRLGDSKMDGLAPDYADAGCEPCHLKNEAWKVMPSVAFVDGMPRVLSCRNHRTGSNGKCFYPPRNPHGTLPSPVADQVAPAVIRPRNMKQFKAHAFSDTFQMSEMRGQFSGVDTFHLSDNRDFSVDSAILQNNEELAMNGRKDIFNLVTEWGDDKNGTLPPKVVEDMVQNAENSNIAEDALDECCRSATFVTLSDAVKLYKANKERRGRIVDAEENGETITSQYLPSWPATIINVHPFDQRGCEFPLLTGIHQSDYDCHLLWSLGAMTMGISSLWEKIDQIVHSNKDWHGWLLTYLTPICFPRYSTGRYGRNSLFAFENRAFTKKRLEELLIRVGMKVVPDGDVDGDGIVENDGPGYDDGSGSDDTSEGSESSESDDGDGADDLGTVERSDIFSLESIPDTFGGSSSASDVDGNFSDGDDVMVQVVDTVPPMEGLSEQPSDVALEVERDIVNEADVDEGGGMEPDERSMFSLGESSYDAAPSMLHTDGTFHAEDIKTLMASFPNIETVTEVDWQKPDFVARDFTEILIVYSCEGRGEFPDKHVTNRFATAMELRFVSGRDLFKKGSSEFAFIRHGGGALSKWWLQTVNGSKSQQDGVDETVLHGRQRWHFAVYVREQNISVERCRDLMLNSMGVEQHVRCKLHDLPLVTAPFRSKESGRICCSDAAGEKCSKRFACCCPVKGCAVSLCLKHKGDVYDTADTVYLSSDDAEGVDDVSCSSIFSLEKGMEKEESHISLNSDQLDFAGPNPWAEHDIFGGEESEGSSLGDGNFVTGNLEVPLEIKGDPVSLPGCVVLNNVGSLLARKQSKGKPSLNFKHYLERMVATTPGRSVPLIYPEAMLFPSLFWKDDGAEGSLLGAMPCGALAHSSTLGKFGIADLVTQMRSRITNPALGTSTDPRYLCYAFDTVVNLGCRHEDTRVVLNRGIVGTNTGIALREDSSSHFNVDSVDSRPTVNKLAAAVAEKQVTYFFTHTPNASDHFGLAPIRDWICSDEAFYKNGGNFSKAGEADEIRTALATVLGGAPVAQLDGNG